MEDPFIFLGQCASLFYFLSFVVLIPFFRRLEKKFCFSSLCLESLKHFIL